MSRFQLKYSQNFIRSQSLVKSLVSRSDISKNDIVLEIGAGKGIITKVLSERALKVLAYEIDSTLVTNLMGIFPLDSNVKIINEDFTKSFLPKEKYKVFANIPFNHTAEILNKLIFSSNSPESIHVIVQKEAANRFMGAGEGTLLSYLIRPLYVMKISHTFERFDFEPQPSVETVLFTLTKKNSPDIPDEKIYDFRDFICFGLYQQKYSLWLRLNKLFTKEQFRRLASEYDFSPDEIASSISYKTWVELFRYFDVSVIAEKKKVIKDSFRFYISQKDNQKKVTRTRIKRRR